jgi:hypothetical protein
MRRHLLSVVVVIAVATFDNATGIADPMTVARGHVPQAPIGHLQPHSQHFSPRSPAEQNEQQQMSRFDAEQQKLDRQLDKSLNICRC